MEAPAKPDIADQIAAAFEWWNEAGVDCDFIDEPRDWLATLAEASGPAVSAAEPAPHPAPHPGSPAPARPLVGGSPEDWPQDLAAFQAWWMHEPSLDQGAVARRVPPRGPAGAELMVLVGDPEQGDGDSLLSGPQGKLLAGIHAALGLGDDQVYVASALPRHTPLPDWRQLSEDGLGAVVRHHVQLAGPQRLLVFGSGASSLMGHDPANNGQILPNFYHDGRSLPLLAAMDLAALLARPRAKAGLWQRLLEWTGTPRRD